MFIVRSDQTRKAFSCFEEALLEARLLAFQRGQVATVTEVSSTPGHPNRYDTLRVVRPQQAARGGWLT